MTTINIHQNRKKDRKVNNYLKNGWEQIISVNIVRRSIMVFVGIPLFILGAPIQAVFAGMKVGFRTMRDEMSSEFTRFREYFMVSWLSPRDQIALKMRNRRRLYRQYVPGYNASIKARFADALERYGRKSR